MYSSKKILILSGSSKKSGNTAQLVKWFSQGARSEKAQVEVVNTALLVANAGESGEIVKIAGIRQKAIALGRKVA